MKDTSQYAAIGKLITRARGATVYELMLASRSSSVHKRMSELRARGWHIERRPIAGEKYGKYFGTKPA